MRSLLVAVALISACGPSSRQNPDGAGDPDMMEPECSDGTHRCAGTTYMVCTGGQWAIQQDCEAACHETLGCVQCTPGVNMCSEGNVHSCNAAGEVGPQTQACTGEEICQSGACVNACEDAAMKRSYTGCEYWAVDLDNAVEVLDVAGGDCGTGSVVRNLSVCSSGSAVAGLCDPPGNSCPSGYTCGARDVCILDAQHAPFAIVVSNPQARSVDVVVTGANGATINQTIAAGQVQAILPQPALPDQSVDGTGKVRSAYKVTSTLPIVAYQFNPLENVNVFSNDASLLIPRAAFDTEYYVMSYASTSRRPGSLFGPGPHDYHGYLTIVAWQDGTMLEVTPKAAVRASSTQAAIAANTPTTFTLNAFEVLTLQAVAPGDLTGTRIRTVNTNNSFGVFGGHEAAGFGEMSPPDSTHTRGPCCADHVEEMLFPTSTWGKTFAITRSQSRGAMEPDMVRIMAQKPNTTLQFDPPPASGTCGTLGPGQMCEIRIQVDTSIIASEPVLVGHYLQSAIWADPFFGVSVIGEGDPSMAIAVPTEQFRNDYTVLVPAQYAKNFLSISAGASGAVLVDGNAVTMTPFAGGTYRAARVMVTAGQHKITCPSGCGVEVYGYGSAVSYMFAGGLDLKQIVIN